MKEQEEEREREREKKKNGDAMISRTLGELPHKIEQN